MEVISTSDTTTRQISPLAAALIVVLLLLIVVGLGYYFSLNKPETISGPKVSMVMGLLLSGSARGAVPMADEAVIIMPC